MALRLAIRRAGRVVVHREMDGHSEQDQRGKSGRGILFWKLAREGAKRNDEPERYGCGSHSEQRNDALF